MFRFLFFIQGALGVILLVVCENSRKPSPAVRNLGLGLIGFMLIGTTSLEIE